MDPRANFQYTIHPGDYESLQFLRDYPAGKVLATRRLGAPMKAISNHEALYDFFDSIEESGFVQFYGGNCSIKEEMFNKKYINASYVHSKKQINCSFLNELYQNENNYVYAVNLN